jgi:hypothetical protein
MLEFLIYNIFVMLGGRVFQQTVGIPMGTNCAPLLTDLFLYSHEADLIQGLLKNNEKKLARSFNFTFRYIDDVLSLNNYRFDVKRVHTDRTWCLLTGSWTCRTGWSVHQSEIFGLSRLKFYHSFFVREQGWPDCTCC